MECAMSSLVRDWKTYRTRFLIKAIQLDTPLTFTDPLGREHFGQKGDYLVESADGLQRIAPREIFEDIYVPMESPRNLLPKDPRDLYSKTRSTRNNPHTSTHAPTPSPTLTRRWTGKSA
jgi:hypothetical protein